MKTPVPTKLAPAAAAISKENRAVEAAPKPEPKFEAWTSRFIKDATLDRDMRSLPVVELLPMAKNSPTLPRPQIAPVQATPLRGRGEDPERGTAVAITASDARSRASSKKSAPAPTPSHEYNESPLTRAKRVDAQNTWREQQLKNFLSSKAESLKSAIGTLRGQSLIPEKSALGQDPKGGSSFTGCQEQIANRPARESAGSWEGKGDEAKYMINENKQSSSAQSTPDLTSAPTMERSSPNLPESTPEAGGASAKRAAPEPIVFEEDMPAAMQEPSVFDFETLEESPCGPKPPPPTLRHERDVHIDLGPGRAVLDMGEMERRRRLKDRNDKALERRRQQMVKAQQIKENTMADLSGRPRVIPMKKPNNLPARAAARPVQSLQKQAMVNCALKVHGPLWDAIRSP